jgi:hypothetical protein
VLQATKTFSPTLVNEASFARSMVAGLKLLHARAWGGKAGSVNYLQCGRNVPVAFDVSGNGKTALRAGWGAFFDIMQTNPNAATIGNPPISYSPTLYFGSLSTYAQSGGVIRPSSLSTMWGPHKLHNIMNFSVGLQQRGGPIRFNTTIWWGRAM